LSLEISERKGLLEHKFKAKYMQDELSLKSTMFHKFQVKQGNDPSADFEENNSDDHKDQLQQKFHESYCTGTNNYKYKQ